MKENDLNYRFKKHKHILLNSNNTVVYNSITCRNLTITRNCRSFGVWIGKSFLTLSRFNDEKELINLDYKNYSPALAHLLSQF